MNLNAIVSVVAINGKKRNTSKWCSMKKCIVSLTCGCSHKASFYVAAFWFFAASLSCVSSGGKYVFDLDYDQTKTSTREVPHWMIMVEKRWVAEMSDSKEKNWLDHAQLINGEGYRFDYKVPSVVAVPIVVLPPLLYGHVSEYRFTVFTPGYAATTIYPLGIYNDGPFAQDDGSLAPFSTPVLLWTGKSTCLAGSHNDGNFPLGGEKQADGSFRSRIPFRKVTVRSFSPDGRDDRLLEHQDRLWRNSRNYTFAAQLNALSEAIAKNQLNRTSPEIRALLLDAINQQYKVFNEELSTTTRHNVAKDSGISSRAQKAYETIQRWAAQSPRGNK